MKVRKGIKHSRFTSTDSRGIIMSELVYRLYSVLRICEWALSDSNQWPFIRIAFCRPERPSVYESLARYDHQTVLAGFSQILSFRALIRAFSVMIHFYPNILPRSIAGFQRDRDCSVDNENWAIIDSVISGKQSWFLKFVMAWTSMVYPNPRLISILRVATILPRSMAIIRAAGLSRSRKSYQCDITSKRDVVLSSPVGHSQTSVAMESRIARRINQIWIWNLSIDAIREARSEQSDAETRFCRNHRDYVDAENGSAEKNVRCQ